jgi:integrase/recombinase XerC
MLTFGISLLPFMPIEKFFRHLQFEKRYSANTTTAYRNDLNQFFSFLEKTYGNCSIKEVNHFMIRSWIVSLMDAEMDSRSVNRKISSLKTLYRFLLREKITDHNPMLKIVSPKVKKRLPEFVDAKNMEALFNGEMFNDDFEGLRDRLILEILYSTGMRVSELTNLNAEDVDMYNQSVSVTGKRNKQRVIPLTIKLVKAIKEYLKKRKEIKTTENNLLITLKGKKMTRILIYKIVNNCLSGVTNIKKRSPHVLRHTFATHMLNNGADINAVKELLGHASLAATQVYTHNTIEKLKSVYKQAHPKA